MIILSFAAALLLFLSNFHLCGVVGDFLRSVQLGLFGSVGYVVPILIFVGTSFYMSNIGSRKAVIKLSAVIAAALIICGLAQMFVGVSLQEGESIFSFYRESSTSGKGGGLIGGLLAYGLSSVAGVIGTYLVFLVILIICGVCITEKSVVTAVRNGSDKAYQYAREDAERRKLEREERQEERRRLREENVVRGVDLSATKIEAVPLSGEPDLSLDGLTEKLSKKGRKKQPFEDELLKEEALLKEEWPEEEPLKVQAGTDGAEDAEPKAKRLSPDDVFSGRIALPPEYEEPVPFAEDQPEEKIISFTRKASGKKEALYAKKETMTMAEMEAGQTEISDGASPAPLIPVREKVLAEAAGAVSAAPAGAAPAVSADAVSSATAGDISPASAGVVSSASAGAVLSVSAGAVSSMPAEAVSEDRPADLLSMEEADGSICMEEEPEAPLYPEEKSESGVNYDSLFVPEEPKRVVTATGKVIETETELLHKKIEKKREEAVEGNTKDAVNAEVKRKEAAVKKPYVFPPTSLLKRGSRIAGSFSEREYKETAIKLQQTLRNFGVGVTVTNISCGPSVTQYELHPEQGVKVSKIVGLADDIKLSLAAEEIRIEAPIPGKSAVGIEVPNKENSIVYLRDLLESDGFRNGKSRLTFAVGKDISGQPVVADIAKMPHLLIAGATGSGKSVCINTLIMSIIFKADPEDVKLIMVDPKVVELSVYNGIPHLLIPVVTDPKKASGALNWAVAEMMDRYKKFAEYNVRDLKGYNEKIKNTAKLDGVDEDKLPKKLPQIVIIIDELADLMMVVPGEVEDAICRLAQLARAAGIHLVIATQRPSVNVITGLIKANVPSRIAFAVSSGVDSRTIIDMNGAEKLLGKGDMLFYPSGFPKPQRVQGAFISDQEVSKVVEFLTEQGITADYSPEVESQMMAPSAEAVPGADSSRDEYFAQAGKFIIEKEKASIGMLQRVFKIGFNRAARIMDQLAEAGVVGEEEGTKPRKVLMTMEEFQQVLAEGK
ncbi:MAG: DNA translocase FtsK [Lachnospiraceae bacterium]|nr:DNA translocase FtsK [Lachnospiraceae bacterium]